MFYHAKVKFDGQYWPVEFPDAPGCVTFGHTKVQALERAKEALEGWLESYVENGESPPRPKTRKGGERIAVPAKLAFALRMRWAREELGLTQQALAKTTGLTQQQIARLEKRQGNPTLANLATVADALGLELVA
jgi:predicted RNase H-like HicB family nuclease/DNA-binding XRE family transcriptional regulator